MLQFAHIDMNGNEIQNVLAQNLASAPSTNVAAGRFYFNTADHTLYVYNGTAWVDALSQGDYTFRNGIEEVEGRNVQLKLATGEQAGNVVFTADANGLAGTVDLSGKVDKNEAITGATKCKITYDSKGLVTAGADLAASDIPDLTLAKITDVTASAAEVNVLDGITASTAELNILDGVTADASEINVLDGITASTAELNIMDGATVTTADINSIPDKIELTNLSIATGSANYLGYDNTTGQFSAKVSATPANNGTDLITTGGVYANTVSGVAAHTTDADKFVVTKAGADTTITINNVAHATSADQDEDGNNIKATYATKDEIADFIELTDLSIATGSANYLTYNNTTGEFGANVDTTVTAASTNLVTSGAVETAIANALVGGVIYKGTWTATGQTDYSGITLPVKQGYLYLVQGSATIGGIEWNAGDYLMVNEDVAEGGTLTNVSKIDNTEAADIVRLNATQTLTNKTISAADNTIADLGTTNFASGVIQTAVRADGTATDTAIATEKAVRDAIDDAVEGMVTVDGTQTLTNKTIDADENSIVDLTLTNMKSGVIVDSTAGIAAPGSASDAKVATEKAIANALATKVEKFTAQNGALTATGGVCTWTIANAIASADVQVAIYQVATGAQVGAYVEVGAANVVVKFNSAADIAANTFKAVIIGGGTSVSAPANSNDGASSHNDEFDE